MVDKKKITWLFFAVIVVVLILILSFFVLRKEQVLDETKIDENKIKSNQAKIIHKFINGEIPSSISLYCDNLFQEDDCRLYFYHFILYNIKNDAPNAFDTNSPLVIEFINYLKRAEPGIDVINFEKVSSNFKSGEPITSENGDFSGLNAAITKDSSFCKQQDIIEKNNCVDEVKFLKVDTADECNKINSYDLYLLCIQGFSQTGYLAELNKYSIE